ncbi:capsular exopolysaccharide family [Dethiosulfatibacter aminovorans DSM 17477]|uniref:non-specific protein-tyrosine kinase n=1 Tax=Dethiosulfatibacter aminovorans DSM 17477 TaxID=1121476 RepID=A0A1M6E8I2_9FIRM|nr:polysaccharide biosynthesis tyrosine autokinase [Dethiosulfatibacter aminovorans]SHI81598.1 capsular exopolysaccharide family [Dethiosulfatibacter aminovorans DSM 17477]
MGEEWNLLELVQIVLKRKWIVVATTIFAAILAILVTMVAITPVYESNTTLMVNSSKTSSLGDIASGFDIGSINLSQKLVVTYSEIVKSRIVLEAVIDKIELDMTYNELLEDITSSPVGSTEILKISVKNTDPAMASEIANTIADVFIKEVMRILKVDNVEIIDEAIPIDHPVNINLKFNGAIGFIVGIMTGLSIILMLEMLDGTIKTSDDIEKHIGLPVIGSIFEFNSESEGIIVHENPKSPISEAYRSLRTNINFANLDNNMKTILITSATPGEGKTQTVMNLAVAMAQNDKKVIVVDCDMRKPRIHKILNISNTSGIAEYLMDGRNIDDYINRMYNLDIDVMTSGKLPGNPSELLQSNVMKKMVEFLEKKYDYVLFDSPPVVPVTDAVVMTRYIEGAILVVASGNVGVDMVKKAKKSLEFSGVKLIGSVLNIIPTNHSKGYNSYYYYYEESET